MLRLDKSLVARLAMDLMAMEEIKKQWKDGSSAFAALEPSCDDALAVLQGQVEFPIKVVDDVAGDTLVHYLVGNSMRSLLKVLLEREDASFNVKNKDGTTPLDLAKHIEFYSREQPQLLQAHGSPSLHTPSRKLRSRFKRHS
jgi:hypothetical protein